MQNQTSKKDEKSQGKQKEEEDGCKQTIQCVRKNQTRASDKRKTKQEKHKELKKYNNK